MNENQEIEKDENKAEEEIVNAEVEQSVDEVTAESESASEAAIKPKSKMFILYICALVVFLAVAVTALVCFGLYANNLVHGGEAVSAVNAVTWHIPLV